MVILIGISVFINYIDRGNLSTAATLVKHELRLSATQLGFLLTAFFITYMPMQPVVGWLVDKFTASRVLVSGFVLWSLATILSGFAHGFVVLSDTVDFLYKTTAFYDQPSDRALRWDDPALGIQWPLADLGQAPVLSTKDLNAAGLAQAELF